MDKLKPLLELQQEYNLILNDLMESHDPHDLAELIIKEDQVATKIDSYDYFIEKLKADQQFFSEKAKEYQKAKKSLENTEKAMKDRLRQFLECAPDKEIKGYTVRFKLSNAKKSLVIDNEDVLPDTYKIPVQTYELDKDALRNALESGEDVPGAHLEGGTSLRRYLNKKTA